LLVNFGVYKPRERTVPVAEADRLADASQHARRIEAVVRGRDRDSGVGEEVRRSWARCLAQYALDPAKQRLPNQVNGHELSQRRARAGLTLAIAEVEMRNLHMRLNDSFGVVLTDPDGVILSYLADPAFDREAHAWGFRAGTVWSEAEQGTNGMGTCIAARAPIIVDRQEHFLAQNTGLTCCAVPILDGTGTLIGALDLSGRVSQSSSALLALLDSAVQNVENRLLLSAAVPHYLLRFHPQAAFVSTPGEGLLTIDELGHVQGANRAAVELLSAGGRAQLCGREISSIFGFGLPELCRLAKPGVSRTRRLPTGTKIDAMMHGCVFSPQARPKVQNRHRAALDGTLDRNMLMTVERDALLALLARCDWNISLAARRLGKSRRTLHRKLRKHGLSRDSIPSLPVNE
jgi:transcriptional regulator of acetoin/glycerol metabolism